MASAPSDPDRWQADVVLVDGGVVHVRPIQPTDGAALVAFHTALSDRGRYIRFLSPHPRLSTAEVERFTCVDMVDRVALVADVLAAYGIPIIAAREVHEAQQAAATERVLGGVVAVKAVGPTLIRQPHEQP